MKIGILGPEGTFSESAAIKWLKKNALEVKVGIKYYETIFDISESLLRKEIDYGVIPIENSLEGSVGDTLDVISDDAIKIVGEILLRINISLLAKNKCSLSNIKKIVSHPHALAQCKRFTREKLKNVEVEYTESTASAATLAIQDEEIASLASEEAAKKYGLNILEENVQDRDSITRFVVLAPLDSKMPSCTGNDKTSILIHLKDRPGALYDILGEFALRKINLTKIESRPSKKAFGDYMFHIDCEGHVEDEEIKEALKGVDKKVVVLKILGSYPKA